jgi:hypothetical protein
MQHSKIVGGSTAKRVINCPGSVALVQRMPPQPASKYAEEGTLLHAAMERAVNINKVPDGLTDVQAEKIAFCLDALDQVAPDEYAQEVRVTFSDGIFGSVDLIGRRGDTAIVLDWKFGDGVAVDAEANHQGMFYAAAARRTPKLSWAVEGTTEVEIIIVQPPVIRRWITTWDRIEAFVLDLERAILLAGRPDAPLSVGDWCRWCAAKPICPQMTGQIDRVTSTALQDVSEADLSRALALASQLESFIDAARALALARLERGLSVPGYKLVAKRAVRVWVDESKAAQSLMMAGLSEADIFKRGLLSPAQAEKVVKKAGLTFPADEVVAVSSGNTIAESSDPRPAVMVLGTQLKAALKKLG